MWKVLTFQNEFFCPKLISPVAGLPPRLVHMSGRTTESPVVSPRGDAAAATSVRVSNAVRHRRYVNVTPTVPGSNNVSVYLTCLKCHDAKWTRQSRVRDK